MKRELTPHRFSAVVTPLILVSSCLLFANYLQVTTAYASADGIPAIAWKAFDGGGTRTGVNTAERSIGPDTVHQLSRIWAARLPDIVDGAPTVLPHVLTPSGRRDLLFMTTLHGSLLAIDANTGALVWYRDTHGPRITTSSAAIDPYSFQYVYSYGVDGKVHRYEVGTGKEITRSWPITITLIPTIEKGSSALNIFDGFLYMTTASYDDDGHYVGHIVAVNLTDAKVTVFNALCSDKHVLLVNNPSRSNYCPRAGGGIWGRAGVVLDPVSGNAFATVGNGNFNADKGGHDYGESILELSPDLSRLIDTYTADNFDFYNQQDFDLGSTSPVMLPRQDRSATPYMLVQVSKNAVVRLINRQNLSGRGGPNHVGGELQHSALPPGPPCNVLTHPVAWNDSSNTTWVFITRDCGTYAYKLITDSNHRSRLRYVYTSEGGNSPFIANGVLFVQDNNAIVATEPTTGRVLWKSSQPSAGGTIGFKHWQTPVVVNSRLYTADMSGYLYAYGLKS